MFHKKNSFKLTFKIKYIICFNACFISNLFSLLLRFIQWFEHIIYAWNTLREKNVSNITLFNFMFYTLSSRTALLSLYCKWVLLEIYISPHHWRSATVLLHRHYFLPTGVRSVPVRPVDQVWSFLFHHQVERTLNL
jgi:hypothetical protein